MKPLRILITNWTMAGRHGSVMYIADLARCLFRRGHEPVVYAPELGEVAAELRALTIAVTDRLTTISQPPDIIIGNSHPDMMAALLQFPGVPGVYVVHAWDNWLAAAPKFPRLRRYVAVDETCEDWLTSLEGIPAAAVRVVFNGVDTDLFSQRVALPAKPARAVVFSNYVNDSNGLPLIREACRRAGIALDVVGESGGVQSVAPGEMLRHYDLVFAKARCALEAMASGCAVIACDYGRLGAMVTMANVRELRGMNFGRRAIRHELTVDALVAEIRRYDAEDARAVSAHIRTTATLDAMTIALLDVCGEVLRGNAAAGAPDVAEELRAAGAYVATMNRYIENHALREQAGREAASASLLREQSGREAATAAQLREQAGRATTEVAQLREQLAQAVAARASLREQLTHESAALARTVAECAVLRAELRGAQKFFEHPFVRFLRSLPGVRALGRRLSR